MGAGLFPFVARHSSHSSPLCHAVWPGWESVVCVRRRKVGCQRSVSLCVTQGNGVGGAGRCVTRPGSLSLNPLFSAQCGRWAGTGAGPASCEAGSLSISPGSVCCGKFKAWKPPAVNKASQRLNWLHVARTTNFPAGRHHDGGTMLSGLHHNVDQLASSSFVWDFAHYNYEESLVPVSQKRAISDGNGEKVKRSREVEVFTIQVRGWRRYRMLKLINDALEHQDEAYQLKPKFGYGFTNWQ
ncbi:uncharacterized protein [Dendrobates tinctorius]|uniref:uncharacterized protein isoform X1 n=1 Tax=Dendrobates tinctorius TaxID=92724 RepID=UPI003CC96403